MSTRLEALDLASKGVRYAPRNRLRRLSREMEGAVLAKSEQVTGFILAWLRAFERGTGTPRTFSDILADFSVVVEMIEMDDILEPLLDAQSLAGKIVLPEYEIDTGDAEEWASFFGGQLITRLWQQDIASIQRIIRDGVGNGKRREDLVQDIMTQFTPQTPGGMMPEWRARLISQTECLPGNALVDGAKAIAVYRRWFDGDLVEIETSAGHKFSGTPNHPVLTLTGWKGLGEITEGDYVIGNGVGIKHEGTSNPNIEDAPSTISDVFGALQSVSPLQRELTVNEDFHGDGQNGYVDILRTKSVLKLGDFASFDERISDGSLSPSDMAHISFFARSYKLKETIRIAERNAFSISTQRSTRFLNQSGNSSSASSIASRKTNKRLAVSVGYDNFRNGEVVSHVPVLVPASIKSFAGNAHASASLVTKIHRFPFSGHVYNLTTEDGYFISNGLFTGNTLRAYNGTAYGRITGAGMEYIKWLDGQPAACESCRNLHEQIIPVNRDGKMANLFYDRIRGFSVAYPPLHPGCRCTIGAALPEEYFGQKNLPGTLYVRDIELPTQRMPKNTERVLPSQVPNRRLPAAVSGIVEFVNSKLTSGKRTRDSILQAVNDYIDSAEIDEETFWEMVERVLSANRMRVSDFIDFLQTSSDFFEPILQDFIQFISTGRFSTVQEAITQFSYFYPHYTRVEVEEILMEQYNLPREDFESFISNTFLKVA